MKNKIFRVVPAAFVLMLVFFLPTAQSAVTGSGTLRVVVDGCPSDQGVVRIALVNSADGYKDSSKAFTTKAVPVQKGKAVHDFRDVPFGEYAVTVYHDANGNHQLDKSIFGKPVEAYGFSNNARGLIGKPDYRETVFLLDRSEMTLTIHVE